VSSLIAGPSVRANVAPDPITDCFNEAFYHHLQGAAEPRRALLRRHVSDSVMIDSHVYACPVHFGTHLFHIDPEGTWAILAPCTDESGWIVDVAAFDPRRPSTVAMLNRQGFALGLEEIFHSRLNEGRVRIHATIWSWLRAECCGILPIDWRRTALHLMECRVAGLIVDNVETGKLIDQKMRLALKPPAIFVDREAVAA
jgi:hypothetical protein